MDMKFLAKLLAQTVGVGLGVFCAILVSKSIEVKDIKENTLISYIADKLQPDADSKDDKKPKLPEFKPVDEGVEVTGGVLLNADGQGHYRGRAVINGVTMPFLLDTGATSVTVPIELARAANMPIGEIRRMLTANGETYGVGSTIKEMKLGKALLKNIDATVSYSLDEVLMGMTALKMFNVKIENGTMRLTAKKGYNTDLTVSEGDSVTKWKKNRVCNADGEECRTTYSE
ncbi:hypothetical protein CEK71_07070 [Methylovulum psychrotolerans]|uniref:TIGR02281 family clan AA aspartic protease n=2 Tax=Methylovulum psychrotolerans TaxID=1704499 RepID=A0A1Z4BX26_9GAMM|nr:hypothetical protein CEK71_07070 [Methylovulum psychrotolerans]